MKKYTIIAILFLISVALSSSIDFKFRITYIKATTITKDKIDMFKKLLEDKFNSYDWKFPHNDFEKIETNISINIEKSLSDGKYIGMVIVSSGLSSKNKMRVALKRDIYYNEQDVTFSMDLDSDPDLGRKTPSAIETILRFYTFLILGENFDRLSYTDQKNFKLEGEFYYLSLYEFENLINSAQERKNWSKRLDIINGFKQNKNIKQRKLNAFLYNAKHFINIGKSKRAEYFIEPIYNILKANDKIDRETFFKNNYNALGEIFAFATDTTYMNFLMKEDPKHKSIYSAKIKKSNKTRTKVKAKDKEVKLPDIEKNEIKR
ncbi:MAG: hypothetical protein KAH33_01525 [Candidatus Delongbacteria bacterium]|nr:hypothetical protein [Candidatus Delongbacteria bacterium]